MEIQYSYSPTVKRLICFHNGYFWFEQSVTYNMSLRKQNIFCLFQSRLSNWRTLLINLIIVIKNYGCCLYKEILHTNGSCLFWFLGFARRIFYPALFTLLYFIILVVAISFWWGTKKNQDKKEQFNITYDQC